VKAGREAEVDARDQLAVERVGGEGVSLLVLERAVADRALAGSQPLARETAEQGRRGAAVEAVTVVQDLERHRRGNVVTPAA